MYNNEVIMPVNAILATDLNGGIGKNNTLPWPHHSEDMKWFKQNTMGGIVVMGRNTWDSLGRKKLPGRINIVITTSAIQGDPDEVYYGDMQKVLQTIQSDFPNKTIWVIGGANIYKQALPFCDKLYLTKFKQQYECDAFVSRDLLLPFQKLANYNNDNEEVSFSIWSKI